MLLRLKLYNGLLMGGVFFCRSIAIGFGSILQSRGAMAGFGILALPLFGGFVGALTWLFGQYKDLPDRISRRRRFLPGSITRALFKNILFGDLAANKEHAA